MVRDICREIGPNKGDIASEVPYEPIIWESRASKKTGLVPNLWARSDHLSDGELNRIGLAGKNVECFLITIIIFWRSTYKRNLGPEQTRGMEIHRWRLRVEAVQNGRELPTGGLRS